MTPSPACPFCRAHTLQLVREPIEIALGQRQTMVVAERMRCTTCDQASITADQLDNAQRAAADRIRAEEGLLMGAEIKRIRESLALTQHDFEQLLGVGPKTVVRWERGTVFQNRATDLLVRLVAASADASTLLASWNAVQNVRRTGNVAIAASAMASIVEASSPTRPMPTSNLDERYDVLGTDTARHRHDRRGRRLGSARVLPIGPHLAKHADSFETRVSLDETTPSVDAAAEQILDAYSV